MKRNESYEFFMKKMGDEKHIIHCGSVINCCLGMIEDTDLNKHIFIVAGWIHDLGKLIDKPNHHIESIKFLDEFLDLYPKYKDIREEVKDCILNHRTNGEPKTIYGLIFKCADKVALHNNKWLEYKKNKKSSKES